MHISNKFSRCYFVGIAMHMLVCSSLADISKTTNYVVVLEQQMFTDLLSANITIESFDGNTINYNQLPSEVMTQLKRLKTSVIPHLELEDAVPQDVVRIIVSKPKPRHMIRLGLISHPSEQKVAPAWFDDLLFGNKKILCIATNVSLLNFSFVFADIFNCEFGITTNGEAMFRNKNVEAKARYPFYLIKPLKQSPTIIKEKKSQKENEQNSIVIFLVFSATLIIAVLIILFLGCRKKSKLR